MTIRTSQQLKDQFGDTDPFDHNVDFVDTMAAIGISSVETTAFGDANGTSTLVTVPANSIIKSVYVVRTTAWDAVTTFEVGKVGDTDWLATTAQSNVTGAIPAGEDGDVEAMTVNKFVTSATAVISTYNAGAATTGAGFVVVEYATVA